MDLPDVLSDLARMAGDLLDEHDVDDTLDGVLQYAQQTLTCDYAGVLLVKANQIDLSATTDVVASRAHELQLECSEGPCLEAIWDHDVYVVQDTAHDPRWPKFGPAVADIGIHSMMGVRLETAADTIGSLNLYCREKREYGSDDLALAHVFAQHAAIAIARARREEGLRIAMDSRNVIGQAQGILMERFDIDADRAFAVLRRYSQSRNVKLRLIAEQVIESRHLPTTPVDEAPEASV